MPDAPPPSKGGSLSQLPGFMPAPQPGTPAFKDFVAAVFRSPSANAAFAQHVSRLATHPQHSTLPAASASEKAAANHA